MPVLASVELLVALALVAAGLKVQVILFMFGSSPWLVAAAALFLIRSAGQESVGRLLHTLMNEPLELRVRKRTQRARIA